MKPIVAVVALAGSLVTVGVVKPHAPAPVAVVSQPTAQPASRPAPRVHHQKRKAAPKRRARSVGMGMGRPGGMARNDDEFCRRVRHARATWSLAKQMRAYAKASAAEVARGRACLGM